MLCQARSGLSDSNLSTLVNSGLNCEQRGRDHGRRVAGVQLDCLWLAMATAAHSVHRPCEWCSAPTLCTMTALLPYLSQCSTTCVSPEGSFCTRTHEQRQHVWASSNSSPCCRQLDGRWRRPVMQAMSGCCLWTRASAQTMQAMMMVVIRTACRAHHRASTG